MNLDVDGPHWQFALDFYGRPGVSAACLLLQDEADVDVVELIFALFMLARRGRLLDHAALNRAAAHVADWRRRAVLPLRAIRRALKEDVAGLPAIQKEALRNRVKSAELLSEQLELAMLVRWCDDHGEGTAGQPAAETIGGVLECLVARAGRAAPSSRVLEAVATLVTATR
jgi:uncharacterized protein (TIGR02444 family)